MIEHAVESSGHEILFSTAFLTYDDGPSSISFSHLDVDFVVNIAFESDAVRKKGCVRFTSDGPVFNLTFVNFSGPFGQGNVTPWQPGKLNNRQLSFRFHVTRIGDETPARRIEFTAYLQKEVQA